MKSIFKKYFLLLWVVIVAAYNAVLFLLFNQFAKETLKETSFWVIYGSMMFAFLVWLVIELLERNTKLGGISPIVTFVYPYLLFNDNNNAIFCQEYFGCLGFGTNDSY